MPKMIRLLARFFPDVMAGISGLLFFPWILGVPGHPTQLVQWGWTIGIIAIVFYLVIYQIVKSSDRIAALNKPAIRSRLDRMLFMFACWLVPAMTIAISLVLFG